MSYQPTPIEVRVGTNAESLLHMRLPSPRYSIQPLESAPPASTPEGIKSDRLVPWEGFITSVAEWFLSIELKAAMGRTKEIPVGLTLVAQQRMVDRHPFGCHRGLFRIALYHLALPGAACFDVLRGSPDSLEVLGGDAFTVRGADPKKKHPDFIFRYTLDDIDTPNRRVLLGDMRLPSDVNMAALASASENGISTQVTEILENMTEYMRIHKASYGFISTWEHTVFLKLASPANEPLPDSSGPKMLFSPPIPYDVETKIEDTEIRLSTSCLVWSIFCSRLLGSSLLEGVASMAGLGRIDW
ncbi:uncharacterized protein EI97DRAFT_276801 [Westerdykella ornata]|uniref:Uncharacterized protein n=1 Tax=Westerdykella ornata TaxID=318751 RepID=A0A6A6JQB2_WESOR|nr:uncharacterized protein EI97DRAFT_276801 [Westerdykella ornata]KAF2277876.1 hypothetical protein EI97DRAFT_276801 [Westerdykella ornata]